MNAYDTKHEGLSPQDQLDLLISRIADGEAGEQDWASFSVLAERQPGAWKALAAAQRDHAAMSLAVGVALHAADRVDLPAHEAAAAWVRGSAGQPAGRPTTLRRIGAVGGWAAAAAVALAWVGGFGGGRMRAGSPAGGPEIQQAGIVPANWTTDDAVNAYLEVGGRSGRVLGELPSRVVVDSQPTTLEGGRPGVEVVFVRQFVEKAIVTDLARLGLDETGQRVPVPVPVRSFVPASYSGPQ